ncbi:MAG: S8 family serine peptidase, partial [Bdellovibrionales bacterium]|nr:S8 family serine peptidase [Bdellovibrionales bacterium]
SVMVGHQIGGRFDGVAPGAQLLDVDFSSPDSEFLAGFYNIGRFVHTLEWLGEHGAEVVNISYSLFFESVQAQEFMAEAISALVKKYNFVISFSAGNNGPGLNSLNRRSIYPDNVLVAGAFVSRDLDAHVHGVTGLPEPGRVIYYSSRGPGPDGGGGPLLISPLSSLTHGAPENTFQAFSGTSSASPALAGAAAVLISAVKQEGMAVDAETIVHALRLSGQSLDGVAFVDQGYGLPKIPRALAIYRQLASGEQFARLTVKVTPLTGPDGAVQKGAFLGAKDLISDRELRIRFSGELSPLVKRAAGENLLRQLKLEYSVPWLTGPSHSWLSLGLARTTVRVNAQALQSLMAEKPGQEFFGEVHFVDVDTGLRIHTLPITVVDDRPWEKRERLAFQIGSRDGVRLHMGADSTVKGYRIKTIIDEDKRPFLGLGFFNTMGISNLPWSWGAAEEEEFFVSTPVSGDYQLTLSRVVGTEADYGVSVEANPLRLELLSQVVAGTPTGSAAEIKAINHSPLGEKLSLELVRKPTKVGSVVGELDSHGDFVAELQITEAGSYEFRLEALSPSQWTFGYDDCYYEFTPESGEVEKDWGREYSVPKESPKGSLKFVCRPFAHSGDDFHREKLVGHLYFLPPGKTAGEVMAKVPQVRVSPGTNTIEVPWLIEESEGALLEVKIKPV